MAYKEDNSKRSGINVDTKRQKVPYMDYQADERTPLLQDKQQLEDGIISINNRIDAQVDDFLSRADHLTAETNQYFGEDKKVSPKKKSLWKQLCCCCCQNSTEQTCPLSIPMKRILSRFRTKKVQNKPL